MTWVLYVAIYYTGISVSEFKTEAGCKAAREHLLKEFMKVNYTVATCVGKLK